MGSVSNLSINYLQSILSTQLQNSGSSTSASANRATGAVAAPQADSQQLSPLAQLLSTPQQLEQTDPNKYQQVTQQIATNLQSAAQTAQTDGNSAAASQLNQLATDFTNASQSGQLPNIQDLAQSLGGGGGHHHHHHGGGPSSSSSSSTSAAQLDPLQIISNTLSQAGVTT